MTTGTGSWARLTAVITAILLSTAAAGAQQREQTPQVKMLTPAECTLIAKRGENEYYIRGPVNIGGMTYENSSISRNGVVFNDIDTFDVITRSCFVGKPL